MIEVSAEGAAGLALMKQHLAPWSGTSAAGARLMAGSGLGEGGGDIVRVTADVGGLHATAAMTPYLGLLCRRPGTRREDLERALYEERRLARWRWVRKTIYVLPVDWLPAAFAATRAPVQALSRRYLEFRGVGEGEFERLAADILKLLRGRALGAAEIRAELKEERDVPAALNLMCDLGLVARGKPVSGWRSAAQRYVRWDEWLPQVRLGEMAERDAVARVVRWYLQAFGPAGESDVAWWTGLAKAKVRAAIADLRDELVRATVAGQAEVGLLLREDLGRLEMAAEAVAAHTVRLLPALDPYLMGYWERERFLDARRREMVYDRGGNATSCILIDGRVAGIWDIDARGEPMAKYLLFEEQPVGVVDEVEEAVQGVGQFVTGQSVRVHRCSSMAPLTQRSAGTFMAPLKMTG